MSSSGQQKDGMPTEDPYKVLGIAPNASETEIKKAYRQLALRYHPDKQSGNPTSAQRLQVEKLFHDIKDARSFLLDSDNAEKRRTYDSNLASQRVRQADEKKRESTMSSRRKRMREELLMRERMARASSTSEGAPDPTSDRFDVDRLRKQGQRMREEYAQREADVDATRVQQKDALERATTRLDNEERQLRLKWSRKKVTGGGHTEQTLRKVMREFGDVERVELLGSKGNAALVTFVHESSCKPCVDAYRTSDTMRATFVGRRRRGDARDEPSREEVENSQTGNEDLQERKLRQAAERERLVRQMELEETGGVHETESKIPTNRSGDGATEKVQHRFSFPLHFPQHDPGEFHSPFELLEKYENQILRSI